MRLSCSAKFDKVKYFCNINGNNCDICLIVCNVTRNASSVNKEALKHSYTRLQTVHHLRDTKINRQISNLLLF